MEDYVSIAALIVAVISALGHFVETAHIKKIKIGCLESDCIKTPPPTPRVEPPIDSTGC